ncbi:MAG: 16S rRNA (adenine(1518)-N(6)/adenine(1519)-N(6))-dimethyltransferase RsmA [bacterium]
MKNPNLKNNRRRLTKQTEQEGFISSGEPVGETMKDSVFAKKSLGQNFLKSQKALNQIIEGAGDLRDKTVLEIGPGMGSLTERLIKTPASKIILIEMDDRLIPILTEKFADEIKNKRMEIVHDDILKVNLNSIGLTKGNYSLIANIPYYITGAIIRNIIGGDIYPERAVVLVQKEVAERIISRDKKGSLLSIAVKAIGDPKIIGKVPKGAFVPSPKVDSAILLIDNISKKTFDESSKKEKRFFDILHAGFAHKRKLLKSNLKEHNIFIDAEKALEVCNIKSDARSETLTLEQWKKLSSLDILY